MIVSKKREFKPIHGAIILSVICHILAIYTFVTFAAEAPKEKLRIVATVDVVDSLESPPPPPPRKKLGVTPPVIPKHVVTPPQPVNGPADKPPGKVGKPGAPGKPNSNGKVGNPGGSGRAGLRTKIDPDLPDVGAQDILGGPGYPVGHGYGVGNKEGTGSGFGQGDGEGNGDGGGEGGEGGGGGGGGGQGEYVGQVTFNASDANGVTPREFQTRKGKITFSFRNETGGVATLIVEGVGGAGDYGDIYEDKWGGVPPGELRVYTIQANVGSYTVTVRNANGDCLGQSVLVLTE